MRILSFADFYTNADPLYKMFNILKLNDIIALQNCGLNSFTRKCIDSWNFFTKIFDCNLSTLNRSTLKRKILSYFIESY